MEYMWPSYDGIRYENHQLKKSLTEEWEVCSLFGDGVGACKPPTKEWSMMCERYVTLLGWY
jgi:hypothetical protein